MLTDLVDMRPPPPNRVGYCEGGDERHLTEGAVMVAFAMHLLRTVPGLKHVAIHPDGEHGKRFDFPRCLAALGFERGVTIGTTSFGGSYLSAASGQSILINPKPGRFDVAADIEGRSFVAECKGGIINSRHPGQLSRLRKGLCEAVGLLLSKETEAERREFAVVPRTPTTEKLAQRMAGRVAKAGIEIALVDELGGVHKAF
jgi:hypothetical protein